jgi:hypothetical protein
MGRNAAATYEQVAAAADQLQADGLTPSAKLVRGKLGVGSLGTVQKHIVEWRSRQGETQSVSRILPPELQRAVYRFLDEEVSRINGELRQLVEQAERATADLANDNEEQAMLVTQLRAELAEQVSFRDKQDGQLTRLLAELKAAREETVCERKEAELVRHELTKIQSRLEVQAPVERELRQLRVELEAEREIRVCAERDVAVLKAQKDILEARIMELKEAASTRDRTHFPSEKEHPGKQREHSATTAARSNQRGEASGAPGIPEPLPSSGATDSAAGGQVDPRQATLC